LKDISASRKLLAVLTFFSTCCSALCTYWTWWCSNWNVL